MALKPLHFFSLVFILFLALSSVTNAKRQMPSDQKPSPFDFIKHLEGCQKGNKTKDIHHLKHYLHQFGYLDYPDQIHANDDDFDHLNPHSKLTSITTILSLRGFEQKTKFKLEPDLHPHRISLYFLPRNLRWPPSKTHLTYGFSPNTPANAIDPVVRAFEKWDSATHFTFSRAQNNQRPDLVIGFHRRDHGDGAPFDGPGGALAHAFAPTNGRFHYDSDETWSVAPATNAFHLETVALHEIGHLLGLGHSSVEGAIMYARIQRGATKNLHADDIQGIRALYNV
ncbi:UNVERIFIED_CONTAM: Metalloendoproteinase 2-MMP [Sesamum radiatum]|uniref:Metalloendoproteinase 2-MMP n=1 Tax=Sesamum radiatum TaxID=300843 RepID=A0AAW2V5X9_SESRA